MFHGVWQLAKRTLTLDARRPLPHVIRLGLAAILLVCVIIAWANSLSSPAGRPLFYAQLMITLLYLSADAIFGFSQVIIEEREAGTLDLLRIAGIPPLSVVLGKAVGKLLDAMLLVVIQYPFTILCVTLGGVGWPQVFAGYTGLMCYLWLMCGVGVSVSAWRGTAASAVWLTGSLLCLYTFLPILDHDLFSSIGFGSLVPQQLYEWNLAIQVVDAAGLVYSGDPWTSAHTLSLPLGAAGILLAWLGVLRRSESGPAVNAAAVRRARHRPRPGDNPVRWHAYQFIMGGRRSWWRRAAILLGIGVVGAAVSPQLLMGLFMAMMLSAALAVLETSWTVSRLFHDDVHEQTWSTLVLAEPNMIILYRDKVLGWLRAAWLPLVCPYVFLFIAVLSELPSFGNNPWETIFMVMGVYGSFGVAYLAYLHVLAWWSLSMGWKAIPLALAVYMVCVVSGTMIGTRLCRSHGAMFFGQGLLALGCLVLSLRMRALIIRRLIILAGES